MHESGIDNIFMAFEGLACDGLLSTFWRIVNKASLGLYKIMKQHLCSWSTEMVQLRMSIRPLRQENSFYSMNHVAKQ